MSLLVSSDQYSCLKTHQRPKERQFTDFSNQFHWSKVNKTEYQINNFNNTQWVNVFVAHFFSSIKSKIQVFRAAVLMTFCLQFFLLCHSLFLVQN